MLDVIKRKTYFSIPLVIILQVFVFFMICLQSNNETSCNFDFHGKGGKELFVIRDAVSDKTMFQTSFIIPKDNEYKVKIALLSSAKDNYTILFNTKEMGEFKKGDKSLTFRLFPKDVIGNKEYIEFVSETQALDLDKECPPKIKYIKFKNVLGYSDGLLNVRIRYDTERRILLKRLLVSILFICFLLIAFSVANMLIKRKIGGLSTQRFNNYLDNSFFTEYTLFGLFIVLFNIITPYYVIFSIPSYIMLFIIITSLPMGKDIGSYIRRVVPKYNIAVYFYWLCSASFLVSFILMPVFIIYGREVIAEKLGNVTYTLLVIILIIKIIRARRQDTDNT